MQQLSFFNFKLATLSLLVSEQLHRCTFSSLFASSCLQPGSQGSVNCVLSLLPLQITRGFSPPWAQGMRTGMCHPWLAVAHGARGSWSFPKLGSSWETAWRGKDPLQVSIALCHLSVSRCCPHLPAPWCSNTTSQLPGLPQTHRIHEILCFINQQLQLLSSLCHKVWSKETKNSALKVKSQGKKLLPTPKPKPGAPGCSFQLSWDNQGLREQPHITQAAFWN